MTTDIETVLNFEFSNWDLGKCSIRKYLVNLGRRVLEDGDGFTGNHPFGNIGRDLDVMAALVSGGFIKGSLDIDGFLEDCDESAGRKLIGQCFDYLESGK